MKRRCAQVKIKPRVKHDSVAAIWRNASILRKEEALSWLSRADELARPRSKHYGEAIWRNASGEEVLSWLRRA